MEDIKQVKRQKWGNNIFKKKKKIKMSLVRPRPNENV